MLRKIARGALAVIYLPFMAVYAAYVAHKLRKL